MREKTYAFPTAAAASHDPDPPQAAGIFVPRCCQHAGDDEDSARSDSRRVQSRPLNTDSFMEELIESEETRRRPTSTKSLSDTDRRRPIRPANLRNPTCQNLECRDHGTHTLRTVGDAVSASTRKAGRCKRPSNLASQRCKKMGAKRKALIFTESRRTQEYLKQLPRSQRLQRSDSYCSTAPTPTRQSRQHH
jgi:hypothetical protein